MSWRSASEGSTDDFLRLAVNGFFVPSSTTGGLPPRIYIPLMVVFCVVFLGAMAYLVAEGFGINGTVFGRAGSATTNATVQQGSQNAVEGGPPAPVMAQLSRLRERIKAHPDDDVALTQLGDLYLASNHFAQAIPLYRQALRANPHNVAAQTGLAQAQDALRQ